MEVARSDEEWLALAQAKGITPDMLYGVDLQNASQKEWLYKQFGYAGRIGEQIKLLGFLRQYQEKKKSLAELSSLKNHAVGKFGILCLFLVSWMFHATFVLH